METLTPVVIVGAGPTGLMLALELALFNIPFRLLSNQVSEKPANQSRALAIHIRTLELLARHDLAERFLAEGIPFKNVCMFLRRQCITTNSSYPSHIMNDTIFKSPIIVNQIKTEQLLEERLIKYGGRVERGMSAEKLVMDEDGHGTSVWVRHKQKCDNGYDSPGKTGREEEEEELIRCKYVVGCDGVHSTVRSSAGIEYKGLTYPGEFILADLHVEWEYQHCPHLFIDRGYMGIFPMDNNGLYRVICKRYPTDSINNTPSTTESSLHPIKILPTLADFYRAFAIHVPGNVHLHSPKWFSCFRIQRRLASVYRRGNIFIAGDAAHAHSPVGGQGMNTGMQDAVNLGWKLARVLRSKANISLLDTYETERLKVGKSVVQRSDSMFNMLTTTNPFKMWLRNILWSWIMPIFSGSKASYKRIRYSSQLSIRYRQSPIVGSAPGWKGILKGGDRIPDGWLESNQGKPVTLHRLLKGPFDHLLVFGSPEILDSHVITNTVEEIQAISIDLKIIWIYEQNYSIDETLLDSFVDSEGKIKDLLKFTEPSYILVRPDGHISHIGPLLSLEVLKRWIVSQVEKL